MHFNQREAEEERVGPKSGKIQANALEAAGLLVFQKSGEFRFQRRNVWTNACDDAADLMNREM